MRYARHASRYSLFTLAVSAALLPGGGGGGPPPPPPDASDWLNRLAEADRQNS
ncbi:hypothetical protein I5F71_32740, partial [Pseudomonas aeruginosa]|nr:hypothetical protein [Pseudomonas aeruginosa]